MTLPMLPNAASGLHSAKMVDRRNKKPVRFEEEADMKEVMANIFAEKKNRWYSYLGVRPKKNG